MPKLTPNMYASNAGARWPPGWDVARSAALTTALVRGSGNPAASS